MLEGERERGRERVIVSVYVCRKDVEKAQNLIKPYILHYAQIHTHVQHTHSHTQKLQNTIFAPVSKYLRDHMSMSTHEHMRGN